MSVHKSDTNEAVTTILFMVTVTAVFIAAVSLVHLLTRDTIARNKSLFLKRAVLRAAGIAVPKTGAGVENLYRERVKETKGPENSLIMHIMDTVSGDLKGCVLIERGAGLWGTIEAVIGFKNDLKTLTGIDFTRQNETPGLGGRITEPWFRDQFKEKHGDFSMKPEGEPTEEDEFDAITGATITSIAVQTIVNRCVAKAASLQADAEAMLNRE